MESSSAGKQLPSLERSITLPGAVALVVGGVVGAGIFVLVEKIAAQAGAAIWLSFVTAIAVSLVGVLPLIQLAGALPRAGAGYLFASRLLSPFWGVMTSFWVVLGGASSTAVVSLTLGVYVQGYLGAAAPVSVIAAGILLLFYVVYLFGVRLAISLQLLMAVQFVSALLLYGVFGLFQADWSADAAVRPALLPPHGATPFLMSVLLAYSTCMGFQVVGELGEEIRNARRTIPLALCIGGALVASLYILVGTVYVALPAPDPIEAARRPLSDSAALFLPPAAVRFIDFGALTAGLTSLNAAAIALPRELFAQARDGMLPAPLARISARTHAPQHAVTVYFLFVAVLLLSGLGVNFFGCAAAIGILAITSALGLAAMRLPARYPAYYARAYITFPRPLLAACALACLATPLIAQELYCAPVVILV
ncbi:MAG TPA: APC family permease, partial [Candidatus Hydrogenedentes bacterium]|nr:APC family permease [Candidatus Hydrogenedentota bacterium]